MHISVDNYKKTNVSQWK